MYNKIFWGYVSQFFPDWINVMTRFVKSIVFVNTQLRDFFTTLDLFCENFNVNRSELEAKLKSIDYEYDAATNQFV